MDSRDDAAALALAVGRTRAQDPERAADTLQGALREHRGDLTIADAAARSGLPLRDAELGLHRLLQTHHGHLSVTDRGELLFRFPAGLANRPFGGALGVLRLLGRGALGLVRWTGRLALTLFLLGYGVFAAVAMSLAALVLAISAEDAAPAEAIGYILWGTFELIGDALFWSFHPLRAPDELDDTPHRQPRAFYERVNGLFLGPPRREHDPAAAARLLVSEVRARHGRIGLGDVVRVTGLLPEAAGPLVSRLLVDYDGHVDVTYDGAIVYRFPALRPSADAPAVAPPAIWRRVRPLSTLTGNDVATNTKILGLLALIAGFGGIGVALGLPFWASVVPLWGSVALVALIFLRVPFLIARRRADRRENGRRAVLRLTHDSACERRGVATEQFAEAWHTAAGARIAPAKLQRLLIDLGGDLVISDDDGTTTWRFPTLELELGALALVRARASAEEREVGAVEFTSLPAADD